MAVFFFFVSLEIKREFLQGELSNPKQALLPIIGAVGGMVVPALFYIFINFSDSTTLNGWAIPSATDIAFSLGVLSLLGKRVPISLKVFLTALAIIDDLGAIVIIAFFYSGNIQSIYLILMLVTLIILVGLNKYKVINFLPYLIVGIFLWDFTHQSGIHATIAGVLLALTIPHNTKVNKNSLLIKTRARSITLRCFWYNAFICICKCRRIFRRVNFCNFAKSSTFRNCFRIIFWKTNWCFCTLLSCCKI